jgi:hypothetical protein
MSLTVSDGALVTKDPSDVKVYTFDWDAENLAAAVTISSQTVTVTAIAPSTTDASLVASTTGTNLGIVSSSRKVAVKLSGGTLGQLYEVTNQIVTSETPAQTKERSFRVLIENL